MESSIKTRGGQTRRETSRENRNGECVQEESLQSGTKQSGGSAVEAASGLIREERCGNGAAWMILDNPKRRNPLSLEVLRELTVKLKSLAEDDTVRVIVLAGAHPAFSAGHDLAEMIDRPDPFYDELFGACCELMAAIREAPQPVIACVDGAAAAAGCQLVAACDLAVASDRSIFSTPGVRIGLFCSTPMVAVTRAVGRKRSMEMLMLGDPINAATALEWGLLNRVVPAEDLRSCVEELAAKLSRFCPETLEIGKRAFYAQVDMVENQAYEHTLDVMSANAAAPFAQEGMRAFLKKPMGGQAAPALSPPALSPLSPDPPPPAPPAPPPAPPDPS